MTDIQLNRDILLGKTEKDKLSLLDYFLIILIIVLLVNVFVQSVWLNPIKVDGESMMTTLNDKDWLYMDKLAKPERGAVVVFKRSETVNYIKRIIALEGDEIYSKNGVIYIKKSGTDEFVPVDYDKPYYKAGRPQGTYLNLSLQNIPLTKVGEGEMYVLGDNRWDSRDSREIGLVKTSSILGIVPDWAIDNRSSYAWYLNFIESVNGFISKVFN